MSTFERSSSARVRGRRMGRMCRGRIVSSSSLRFPRKLGIDISSLVVSPNALATRSYSQSDRACRGVNRGRFPIKYKEKHGLKRNGRIYSSHHDPPSERCTAPFTPMPPRIQFRTSPGLKIASSPCSKHLHHKTAPLLLHH